MTIKRLRKIKRLLYAIKNNSDLLTAESNPDMKKKYQAYIKQDSAELEKLTVYIDSIQDETVKSALLLIAVKGYTWSRAAAALNIGADALRKHCTKYVNKA